jgi:hypothetical protein
MSPAPTSAPTKVVVALTADELNQEGIKLFSQQRVAESESAFREISPIEPLIVRLPQRTLPTYSADI